MIWGKGSATAERLATLTAGREAGLYQNLSDPTSRTTPSRRT